MGKRILCLLMVVVISFIPLNITTNAEEEKLIKVTEDNVEELIIKTTLAWAEMLEPELKFTVGDIIKINSVYSDEIEYAASLFCNTIPYGYVVIGFCDNNIVIKESNISKWKEGIYTEIVDKIDENTNELRSNLDIDDSITKIAPLHYSLAYKDNKGNVYVMDNYGNDLSNEEELSGGSKNYGSPRDIYISYASWSPSKYLTDTSSMVILKKYLDRTKLISEKNTVDITQKYACGVQALLQIAYMEKLVSYYTNSEVNDVYNKLWNYCKITETQESISSGGDVTYGEGNLLNAENGFVRLAKEKGYTNTTSAAIENPSVLWITDKLSRNYPILMMYGINVNGERSGHFISILGYRKAKDISNGKTYNYLQVYNSWDDTYAFLNYSTVDFTDCEAVCFNVKK